MSIINYQFFRERLTLFLIALLPFHAFLVTVGTFLLFGPDHPPSSVLAVWKEALLAVILLLALIEIVMHITKGFEMDGIDWCILALLALAVALQLWQPLTLRVFAYGFKYDFVPLLAFFLCRRVEWSEWFRMTALRLLLGIAIVVALYGLLSLLLPDAFFHQILGYSDFHSLYKPASPLAPFQYVQNTSTRRMQSVLSGPNQLGLWLLIALSVALVILVKRKNVPSTFANPLPRMLTDRRFALLVIMLILPALFLTYSRTSWIGAGVIAVLALLPGLPRTMRSVASVALTIILVSSLLFLSYVLSGEPVDWTHLPFATEVNALLRLGSSRGHFELPLHAVQTMAERPLGLGIGTVGPASNATSDACVLLRPQDDPSWAKNQPDLCVFTGTKQVQPRNRICHCPFLTENWYLQIGVELGWAGMILFVFIVLQILGQLHEVTTDRLPVISDGEALFSHAVFLAFLGISIGALLLHAWEDSAVAYTLWMLAAVVLAASIESPSPAK